MEQTHFFSYAAHTDIGRKRKENQDNFQVFFPKSEEEQKFRGFLFVVADGMGGHLGGKTASQLAVNTICEKFKKSSERF
ncbi:protein phosphatase 2C domain-containing protein, partial [bacterium]|nr:protein phosphatase 2C domain-containing protein [bacterium]